MVEGAVVLPVLAVFFGVMMYVHNAYLKKMQVGADARFAAFSNAAHGCPAGGSAGGQSGVDLEVPAEANARDADKDVSLESTWLKTTANKTAVAVALGRTRTVTATSVVYCNPATVESASGGGKSKMAEFVRHALGYVSRWARGLI